jgi:hypothetical protein
MALLSKEEKIQVINSHKRNLEYRKYALELDVLVENAKTTPNSSAVNGFQSSILEIDNQVAALNEELATVNALEE